VIIITKPRAKRRKETSAPKPVIKARIVVAKSVRRIEAERHFEKRWGDKILEPKT